MSDDSDNYWDEFGRHFAKGHRPHAGYWTDEANPSAAELGVARFLAETPAMSGHLIINSVRHRGPGNDPPDCEADDGANGKIGIEVTELVDGTSVSKARRGDPYDWKDWTPELIPRLSRIIRRKDSPAAVKGGPYSSYVLTIYTDEPWLEIDTAAARLSEHLFPETSLITRAFLLLSYCPFERGCPCIELKFER